MSYLCNVNEREIIKPGSHLHRLNRVQKLKFNHKVTKIMATSNTNTSVNSLSDLANWVDTQLSIIIDGTSSGYSLGNHNSVWIDKGDTVFTVSLGDGTEVTIDSGNFNTAEEIAAAILATIPVTKQAGI